MRESLTDVRRITESRGARLLAATWDHPEVPVGGGDFEDPVDQDGVDALDDICGTAPGA